MNSILYLICLINLVGIILIVLLLESHSRLHSKLKSLQHFEDDLYKLSSLIYKNSIMGNASHYWTMWRIQQDLLRWQRDMAAREEYETAEQLKIAISAIETLLDSYRKDSESLNSTKNKDSHGNE